MELTVAQLANFLGAELVGDGSGQITAVGPLETACQSEVTFIADDRFITKLESLGAGAVIVSKCIEGLARPQLIVKDVNAALIKALNIFAPKLKAPGRGIHPSATIGKKTKIAKTASIGPNTVIDDGAIIGANTVIEAGCKIGQNSHIGKNCQIHTNVVIYHHCKIGNNVVIQANTTIGSTGFGYCLIDGQHRLIPHNGGVVIEDFVEIGANCCIDRAKFGNTIIGAGTKIDNLVQIAHNVIIGKCCLIAGQVGISGSCKLGDGVVLAGQVGLADNIEIGAGTMVGAQSGVMNNIPKGARVVGSPAIDSKETLRLISLIRRLPKLASQLKQLSKRVERFGAANNDSD